ncbi:MAG: 50S ribosomal protein L5 [Gammaproteobacteria bacterium TMED236]|nr:MAG: 50S ribosomal protein L5 [Gammaproteobacteria bacterium TMED236]
MMNLKDTFNKELLPQLQEKLGIDNVMAVPKLTKVVINMGVGEALTDKKHLESAVNDLELIAGQKAVITKAKKSVASFKLREGWPVGCKVTLRGNRMYDFIERLVNVAIPRERDFRGLNPRSFDGQGNYSMGIKEQIIFPEINYDNIDKIRGMDISINTSASNKEDAKALLEVLNFPFKNKVKINDKKISNS